MRSKCAQKAEKRREEREKRAERRTKSCGEEASEHPRACSRVGGETSQMDRVGPGGEDRPDLRCEE